MSYLFSFLVSGLLFVVRGEPESGFGDELDIGGCLDRVDLKTYSWRQKEQSSLVPPSQSSFLVLVPNPISTNSTGNAPHSIPSPILDSPAIDDLSLPIAL